MVQNQVEWNTNKQRTPLRQRLQEFWSKHHKLQLASEATASTGVPVLHGQCLKHGICVCSGDGLHARMLHNNMVSVLRSKLVTRISKAEREAAKAAGKKKKESPSRVLMDASQLVLRLSEDGPGLKLDAAGWPSLEPDDEEGAAQQEVWLHVNYMNFKDMEFTVLRLHKHAEKQVRRNATVLSVPDRPQSSGGHARLSWNWIC